MKTLTKLALIAAATFLPSAAHAGCVGVTVGGVPALTFDPFAVNQPGKTFDIIVAPTGCQTTPTVEFWFRDDVPPPPNNRKIGGVPLELRYAGTDYLASTGNSGNVPSTTFSKTATTNLTIPIDIALLPSGATAAQSTTREFSLYYRSSDDLRNIQRVPLVLSLAVIGSFQLSVNGSGIAALNFGTIQPGAAQSLMLTAKGTQPFAIRMESLYQQSMRRTSTCGLPIASKDVLESIDYGVALGGRSISITSPYTDQSPSGGEMFEKMIPFTVTIDPAFDPKSKRAGNYCDVIQLKISGI